MWGWLRQIFLRHETWVLGQAERRPAWGLLYAASLGLWLVPVAGLVVTDLWFLPTLPLWLDIPLILLPIFILAMIAPWGFSWYICCIGLWVGTGQLAAAKRASLSRDLSELNRPRAIRAQYPAE